MELILVRHGHPETVRSAAGADPALTAEGRDQSDRLGRFLAADGSPSVDVVYTSPMRRARETAEILDAHLHVGLHVDRRLAEFDLGAPDYVPVEISTEDRAAQWQALRTGVWGRHTFDPDAFEHRVLGVFSDLVESHPGSAVAVVCHNGVINSFLSVVLGRPRGMFVRTDYTSFSRLVAARSGQRQLRSINETPHLLRPGPARRPTPAKNGGSP